MGTLKCRRFDIFLADLLRYGIEEEHYVICVSNWKNNIKADSINCCMITSKIKKHPSHVNFIGFGLKKESQVKCEKLFTINKLELIEKVGNINDVSLQISIERALAQQLQLDSKYNTFDALEMEKLFIDNNNKVEANKVKLEKLKSELHFNFHHQQYTDAIATSNRLKKLAEDVKGQYSNEFIWYSLYVKALSNLKLHNVEESLTNIQEGLVYISKPQGYDQNYSLTLWVLGCCYSNTQEVEKATKIYQTLSKYYKTNYENIMRASCIFNTAKMKQSKNRMVSIYRILSDMPCTNRSLFNTDKYKQEVLVDMKKELDVFDI